MDKEQSIGGEFSLTLRSFSKRNRPPVGSFGVQEELCPSAPKGMHKGMSSLWHARGKTIPLSELSLRVPEFSPETGGVQSFTPPVRDRVENSVHFKKKQERFFSSTRACQTVSVSSGRDALNYIIQHLRLSSDDQVLLPAYLCSEVLAPFITAGIPYTFYRVTENLQCDIKDIQQKITHRTKMVLLIHYFGFPQPVREVKKILKKNILLVEDCVHGFLSTLHRQSLGSFGDISFTSYRKYFPVPDGAKIELHSGGGPPVRRTAFLYPALRTILLLFKGLSLQLPGLVPDSFFYRSFTFTERFLSLRQKPARMSFLSQRILPTVDLQHLAAARRKNYAYLLAHVNHKKIRPLFPVLPEGVCPLGFPILCQERDQLKEHLIARRIYPPIHWTLPEQIDPQEFPPSSQLSKSILTIPCDQRYTEKEMDKIITTINNW